MHSSAREAKLQALLFDRSEVREGVDELVTTYEAFHTEDVRGTCLAHIINMAQLAWQPNFIFDKSCLHNMSIPEALLSPLVQFLNQQYMMTVYSLTVPTVYQFHRQPNS